MKPKILVIGHARHGKDHVGALLAEAMDLAFTSSSYFVGQEIIWDTWGKSRYPNFEAMFADRANHREVWANMISAYNTPDKDKTAQTMLNRGNNLYVGMRRRDELEACNEKGHFDLIVWVDAKDIRPLEPATSMELNPNDADVIIDNNVEDGDGNIITVLDRAIADICKHLENRGFDIGNFNTVDYFDGGEAFFPPKKEKRLEWEDAPEGATQVLDHGFIQVKEVMGTDASIAESARMSYGRGTKTKNTDAGLINYLLNNHHTSPFEMGEIRFHIRMPIFVARQWIRHRTANLNEYSGRYSQMVRLFYTPDVQQIRVQDKVNKQASAEKLPLSDALEAQRIIARSSNKSFDNYESMLNELGVSRETARMVLPLNTYTEVVWKLDVSNLIKFLFLRDDSHAQWEIQEYAKHIAAALEEHFPETYAAYLRMRGKVSLTEDQVYAISTGLFDGLSRSEALVANEIWVKAQLRFNKERPVPK